MKTFARGVAWLAIVVCAGWMQAPIHAANTRQTVQDVSRVSGSIYPSLVRPAPRVLPKPAGGAHPFVVAPNAQGITAVCLTSQDNAAQCQASMDDASAHRSGCGGNASYDAGQAAVSEPSSVCHGNYEPSFTASAHMAYCDVEDSGLAHCLSRYAKALVKQPEGAKRTLSVAVRDAHGALSTVTVLAKAAEGVDDIAKAALEGMSGATAISMHETVYAGATPSLVWGEVWSERQTSPSFAAKDERRIPAWEDR